MIFPALVLLIVLQRLHELSIGRANLESIRDRVLAWPPSYERKLMYVLHSGWFMAMIAEYFMVGRIASPAVFVPGIALLIGCQWIRYESIAVLQEAWVPLPVAFRGQVLIKKGIYRWLRHPNYWAVAIEMFVVPILGGAWMTSLIFGVLNLLFLANRVRLEDFELKKLSGLKKEGLS